MVSVTSNLNFFKKSAFSKDVSVTMLCSRRHLQGWGRGRTGLRLPGCWRPLVAGRRTCPNAAELNAGLRAEKHAEKENKRRTISIKLRTKYLGRSYSRNNPRQSSQKSVNISLSYPGRIAGDNCLKKILTYCSSNFEKIITKMTEVRCVFFKHDN